VRDIEWILDSFEQLVRKSPYTITNLFSKEENINVYTRSKSLLIEDGILGYSYTTLKHAITSIEKNMIYILEYEKLCRFPEQTMKEIYTFIDQDHYDHDFDNLENSYNQFYEKDSNLSEVFNIRKKLEYIPRQMIIPPDILEEVRGLDIWR
jgi:sulfotransferase